MIAGLLALRNARIKGRAQAWGSLRMKFDMSAAWRDAMAMVSANREVLLVISGIFFFLPSAVLGFAIGDVQEAMLADPENAQNVMLSVYSSWSWLIAVVGIVTAVGYLALLALLRDHRRPTVGEAIKTGLIGLLPAIGTYILLTIGIGLVFAVLVGIVAAIGNAAVGFVVGLIAVIVMVYVMVKVSLAGPLIAIDKVYNPLKVLIGSWRLTKGNSVRLFLFYLLLLIAYAVIAIVVSAVIGLLAVVAGSSVGLALNAIVSALISAVVTVIFVAVLAGVHRQLSGPSAAAVSETFE
jgi:MFS family permease